jgi:acyl carrier protein
VGLLGETLEETLKLTRSNMTSPEHAEIANRIRRVFVQSLVLNLSPDETARISDLSSVAGLDSLALLGFVAGLEKEFSHQIDPEHLNLAFLSDLQALTDYFAQRIPQDC